MKYKLVNNIITDNYAKELLRARGVEDFYSFLDPSVDFLHNPLLLDNMEKGADLLITTLQYQKKIGLIVDCDVDGYTSAAIFYQYVKDIEPDCKIEYFLHSGKQHGLEDLIETIENRTDIGLVVLPDASSNDYEYHSRLNKIEIPILILDHHEAEKYSEYAIVINNQLSPNYPNKHLTGAGVVWQFCRYLDKKLGVNFSQQYIDLAALGLISDMANVLDLENRYIIKTGLKNPHNYFFKILLDKQSYSLGNQLTPMGIAFYVTPLINALIRVGSQEEKEKLFTAFLDGEIIVASTKRGEKGLTEKIAVQVARECTNARNKQNRIKEKVVENLTLKIQKYGLLSNKILLIELDEDENFPSTLTGLIAMQLASEYKKPTIVTRLDKTEEFLQGSIRGLNNSELKDFKGFINESNFFEFCEGHSRAAGCKIKKTNIEKFHDYANEKLVNYNFNEKAFEVNFILEASDRNISDLIYDLDDIKDSYGQMNEEPLILIKNLRVNKKDVSFIGANANTIKLVYNNVTYIKFRAEELKTKILESNDILNLTVVGKSNLNNYNGFITPQIMIEEWEINSYSIFDF